MAREIKIGNRLLGDGHPTYIVAEIGVNHNGDLDNAKRLIQSAAHAGAVRAPRAAQRDARDALGLYYLSRLPL